MLADFEQIQADILSSCRIEAAKDENTAQQEQDIRNKYEKALARQAAALEAGKMEEYRAAGLEAEERRLELEFIDKTKHQREQPAATAEENSRIYAGLIAESARIRAEGLDKLKKLFSDIDSTCSELLRQLSVLDELHNKWRSVVMHNRKPESITDINRLMFAQFESVAKAQLAKYEFLKKGG